jgi:GNAT superfamily N-acetyltransferase
MSPTESAPVVRIRVGTVQDAEQLAPFARRVFDATFAADNDPVALGAYMDGAFNVARQREELRHSACTVLLAHVDDALAAWALLRDDVAPLDGCELPGARPLYLNRFYVDQAWHGRGVARALMSAVHEHTRARGHDALWLSTWERNTRAIRFYEREGFVIVGTTWFPLGEELQRDYVLARTLD